VAAEKSEMSGGQLAQLACVYEVAAPKAGNVHPGASFADATWLDFVASAAAIAPLLDRAAEAGVGCTVLRCVHATRAITGSNTNLGIILLLAPLCAADTSADVREGTRSTLARLTPRDAADVFEAIRLANPGGLGAATTADVSKEPTISLIEAMRLAANRDAVARQYANDFTDIFERVAPTLAQLYAQSNSLEWAITVTHLMLMADEPDSLIRRKCGDEIAGEAQRRAAAALAAIAQGGSEAASVFHQLDNWLRADGNRRNPGTSADLIAAGLFVALRTGAIQLPVQWQRRPSNLKR